MVSYDVILIPEKTKIAVLILVLMEYGLVRVAPLRVGDVIALS